MSLEDIEKELYRSGDELKKRRKKKSLARKPLPPAEAISESWSEEAGVTAVKPVSWAKRIIIGGIVFGLLVVGGAVFFISSSGVRNAGDITIQIYSPDEVYRGVPVEINLDIVNSGQIILKDATLTLDSTTGLVPLASFESRNVFSEGIGDVGIGSLSKKSYRFLAVGDLNSVQKVTATLSYFLNSNTRYETKQTATILIKNPAVVLAFKKPDQILGGSSFEFEINYQNNSSFDYPDVVLDMAYPEAFEFDSASLSPASLNNRWDLGALAAGSKGSLKIKGTLNGSGGDNFNFAASVSATFGSETYKLAALPISLTVASSPIDIQITVNNRSDYVARLSDKLTYAIQYRNLSGIALANVVITTDLEGEMFDYATLSTNANVDSLTNRLTWNASNVANLRLLDPGAAGSVSFDIKLKNQFPINRLNDKNFSLRLAVNINSPSVPYYLSASETRATLNLDTKVAGLTSLLAKAFYRDADSGILNNGTLPPRVNQPTQYTIHWFIVNYSTDINDVKVSAALASGVSWTGQIKSNIDSVPLYDERTGEVTWTIPKIIATKGVISDPVEAVFQISAVPNAAQVNLYEPLLSESNLSATDEWSGIGLSAVAPSLSTNLIYDLTVSQSEGRVVP